MGCDNISSRLETFMDKLLTHILFCNSSFLIFLVHTLAQQNILIVHPSLHHFCLPSLSLLRRKRHYAHSEWAERRQAHYVGMAGRESTVFSAWIGRGAPLGKKGWGERERGRDVSRYYYHCHCAVVERNTLDMLTYPKERTFGE